MNWRLLLDKNVYPRLSQSLQQRDINATHIQEIARRTHRLGSQVVVGWVERSETQQTYFSIS
jgi:predicted nuclease of predicted toxin-antitoxin system